MLQNFRTPGLLAVALLKQHVSHQMPDHLLPYLATTQSGRLPPLLRVGRLLLQTLRTLGLLVPGLLMLPILRTPGLLAPGLLQQCVPHQMPHHLLPAVMTVQAVGRPMGMPLPLGIKAGSRLTPLLHVGRLLLQTLRALGLLALGALMLQMLRALGLLAPGLRQLRDDAEDHFPYRSSPVTPETRGSHQAKALLSEATVSPCRGPRAPGCLLRMFHAWAPCRLPPCRLLLTLAVFPEMMTAGS